MTRGHPERRTGILLVWLIRLEPIQGEQEWRSNRRPCKLQFMQRAGGAIDWMLCKADKAIAERLHRDPSPLVFHLKPQLLHLAQTRPDDVELGGKQNISRDAGYPRLKKDPLALDSSPLMRCIGRPTPMCHEICPNTRSAWWARLDMF